MKRLPSLLLSLVLSLALLVPVFAADACTEVSYTDFTCGKEMHFTEHYCRNGDKTIRVESADACAVSHLDAAAQTLTVESTVDGKTSTVSFPSCQIPLVCGMQVHIAQLSQDYPTL